MLDNKLFTLWDQAKDSRPLFLDASHKYEIKNILNIGFPRVEVKKLDKNIEIENTYVFKLLLEYFNKAHWKNLSTDSLLYSRSSFDAFITFLINCILKRYLVIRKECEDEFLLWLTKLRSKYNQNLRSIDIYYDIIVEKIFYPKGLTKKDSEVREQMYFFDQAYSLMKVTFKDEKRENGQRYFEHIKWVMDIILQELPHPNLEKILIALLHDVQEDFPEYADVVRKIYWDYIADWVQSLSKKSWESYLSLQEFGLCWEKLKLKKNLLINASKRIVKKHPDKSFMAIKKIKEKDLILYMTKEERKEYDNIQNFLDPFIRECKERRNMEYFWNLDHLNDDYLDVKFADRIHNLRDIGGLTKNKAVRKVQETEKYFLEIAKKKKSCSLPIAFGSNSKK
jgi:hypothetical protein